MDGRTDTATVRDLVNLPEITGRDRFGITPGLSSRSKVMTRTNASAILLDIPKGENRMSHMKEIIKKA